LCSSCNIIMCTHISREAFAWSFFSQSFFHVSLLVVPIAQSHVCAFLEKVLFDLFFVKPFVHEFVCSSCSMIELDFWQRLLKHNIYLQFLESYILVMISFVKPLEHSFVWFHLWFPWFWILLNLSHVHICGSLFKWR
jgi:hypothetical protein